MWRPYWFLRAPVEAPDSVGPQEKSLESEDQTVPEEDALRTFTDKEGPVVTADRALYNEVRSGRNTRAGTKQIWEIKDKSKARIKQCVLIMSGRQIEQIKNDKIRGVIHQMYELEDLIKKGGKDVGKGKGRAP